MATKDTLKIYPKIHVSKYLKIHHSLNIENLPQKKENNSYMRRVLNNFIPNSITRQLHNSRRPALHF